VAASGASTPAEQPCADGDVDQKSVCEVTAEAMLSDQLRGVELLLDLAIRITAMDRTIDSRLRLSRVTNHPDILRNNEKVKRKTIKTVCHHGSTDASIASNSKRFLASSLFICFQRTINGHRRMNRRKQNKFTPNPLPIQTFPYSYRN